jgi:hypothetical protein
MDLAGIARRLVQASPPAMRLPAPTPGQYKSLLGLYATADMTMLVRLEWRDGKLAFVEPGSTDEPTEIEPAGTPDTFTPLRATATRARRCGSGDWPAAGWSRCSSAAPACCGWTRYPRTAASSRTRHSVKRQAEPRWALPPAQSPSHWIWTTSTSSSGG